MKKALLSLAILLVCAANAQQVIPLWPKGQMPNSKGLKIKDSIANERQYVVASPNIEVFTPSKENRNFAVLIIPGGGYAV